MYHRSNLLPHNNCNSRIESLSPPVALWSIPIASGTGLPPQLVLGTVVNPVAGKIWKPNSYSYWCSPSLDSCETASDQNNRTDTTVPDCNSNSYLRVLNDLGSRLLLLLKIPGGWFPPIIHMKYDLCTINPGYYHSLPDWWCMLINFAIIMLCIHTHLLQL